MPTASQLATKRDRHRIGIGADPEFILTRGRGLMPAHTILPGDLDAPIGTDAHAAVGELRPRWGTAWECFLSVDELIAQLADVVGWQHIDVYAGAYTHHEPLGGHIHISGRPLDRRLVRALDRYIAEPLNHISDSGRRRTRYGQLGAVRGQPHGWEYRSAPSWLAHPALALGALTIAEVLARQGHLPADLETWEQLEELCASGAEVAAIEAFRLTVQEFRTRGTRLETIEVLHAWGKRARPRKQPQAAEEQPQSAQQPQAGGPGVVEVILSDAGRTRTYTSSVLLDDPRCDTVYGRGVGPTDTADLLAVYIPEDIPYAGTLPAGAVLRRWAHRMLGLSYGLWHQQDWPTLRDIIEDVRCGIARAQRSASAASPRQQPQAGGPGVVQVDIGDYRGRFIYYSDVLLDDPRYNTVYGTGLGIALDVLAVLVPEDVHCAEISMPDGVALRHWDRPFIGVSGRLRYQYQGDWPGLQAIIEDVRRGIAQTQRAASAASPQPHGQSVRVDIGEDCGGTRTYYSDVLLDDPRYNTVYGAGLWWTGRTNVLAVFLPEGVRCASVPAGVVLRHWDLPCLGVSHGLRHRYREDWPALRDIIEEVRRGIAQAQ